MHETLSQAFDEIVEFDRVADGLLRMVGDVAASWGGVSAVRQGSFGLLSADVATSLAMIITELCQNAVEHGLADLLGRGPGGADARPTGGSGWRSATTAAGCPTDFDWRTSRSLGLSIVTTLVAEMEGTFDARAAARGPGHPRGGGDPARSRWRRPQSRAVPDP